MLRIETLLYSCVCLLLGFSATVSVAAPPQEIAQANSREVVNRPTLQVGSKGERVTELQAALQLLGFYTGTVDGVYNESTASAVSRFQEAAGLKADGVVNATTWQRLFPNDPVVASSGSSSNASNATRFPAPSGTSNTNNASRFPAPSGTSDTNQVVVPTSNSRPITPNTSATSTEPRPTTATATPSTTATSTEPRPATTNNRRVPTEPRPATTANTRRTSVRQSATARGSTRTEQTTRIQQGDRQSISTRSSIRSEPTTRIQQSDRPRATTRSTREISSIQYTSEGLPILRPGMRGSQVVKLQQRLQRLGFLNTTNIDGDFGAATEAAVIALQKRYGLNADGVVGGATWDILTRRRGG